MRPVIAFVVLASGLKYVGVSTTALGWFLVGMLGLGAAAWLEVKRPWRRPIEPPVVLPSESRDTSLLHADGSVDRLAE
jgi:hypothetical protein